MEASWFEERSTPVTETGCWIWLRYVDKYGYGTMKVKGHFAKAHRASYEAFNGHIPDGLHVMHKCDTPSCINPSHLMLGNAADNMADMARKGRCNSQRGVSNGSSKLSDDDVRAIRKDDRTNREIAKDFGVSHTTIGNIKNNQFWKHVA